MGIYREEEQRRFISAYAELVGRLSRHNHSLLWWATDISSKNRFFSPLERALEQIFKGEQTLSPSLLSALWAMILRIARILQHMAYIAPRIIKARRFSAAIARAAADPTPVYVVRTCVAGRSFDAAGNYKDIFFGCLPDFLSKRQRVIIFADVMDDFSKTTELLLKHGKDAIYPLEAFLRLGDVLKASWRMLFFSIRVPDDLTFLGRAVCKEVRAVCAANGSKIQPLHLYQYFAMSNLLKYFKVEKLLLTCEFNPWEKMFLAALKEHAPSAKTVGYQHTVVPQASVNMFTSHLEEDLMPKPDVILTVGPKPKDIIARYQTAAIQLKPACALRFEYLIGQPQSPRTKRGQVLLVLEGMPQVAQIIAGVVNQLAAQDRYCLRIRTHPFLPLKQFVQGLLNKGQRLEISSGTLVQDLAWADAVIYWGSTVALEAVGLGKPVVHYDNGSLLSFDPLFELSAFKWRFGPADSLVAILDGINALSDEEYAQQRQAAQAYVADYFYPVTEEAMALFLGAGA